MPKANEKKKLRHLSPEKFKEQVVTAGSLYDDGKLEEAIELLKGTLKASPISYSNVEKREIWELLGDLYAELGQPKKAGMYYRRYLRFVKEDENRRDVTLKLVEIYWQIGVVRQLLNLLEGLCQADPSDWAVLLQLHAIYTAFRRTEQSADIEQRLEQLAGTSAERWRELSAHYLYQKMYDRALSCANQVLELASTEVGICILLAEIAQCQENDELSVMWYRRALEFAPDELDVYQELAYLYVRLEQEETALEVFEQGVEQALKLDVKERAADFLAQKAALLVKQQDWSEARRELERALALVPDHLTSLYGLIGIEQATDNWSVAIEMLQAVLISHPLVEKSYIQSWMGLIYLQAKQSEAAIEIFRGLLQVDKKAVEPRFYLAMAYKQAKKYRQAAQEVNRVLRHNPGHKEARSLHAMLTDRKKGKARRRRQERKANAPTTPLPPLEPLKLPDFINTLDIEAELDKVVAYLENRYWKERDPRGKKPDISFRTVLLVQVALGIKDWKLAHLYRKLKEKGEEELRLVLGFSADPANLPTYEALAKRIRSMGVYPLKYLSRKLSQRAVRRGYVKLDEVLLDTSLIAASCDMSRFDPNSPTGYTEWGANWSYPKYGRRIFGFKLALVTNGQGDILDVAVSPANVDDITLGKQAVERLAQTLAGSTIRYLLADSGYCSIPLRELVQKKLGAMPLIGFNPRNKAQKKAQFTYLDDNQKWLVRKREIRQTIERTFAYLKQVYGLKNLSVRGFASVSRYLIGRCLGAIAVSLVAHELGRPDLKTRPSEVLYTY